MTVADDKLVARMMDRFTQLGFRRAFAAIPKRFGFLQADLEIQILKRTKGRLYLDPYYAVYVHDGSGPLSREGDSSAPPYIWYKNPKDDPRLTRGRTPSRASNLRHLTPAIFRRDFAARKLIIRRKIKRRKGALFFDNKMGMRGFKEETEREGKKMFSAHIKTVMGDNFKDREVIG